jgi:hypothetical protein
MQRVGIAAEGLVNLPVPRADRGRAVDVQRRAFSLGDSLQRHAVAQEFRT